LDAKCINEISDSESNPDLIISKYRRIKDPKPAHLLLTNVFLNREKAEEEAISGIQIQNFLADSGSLGFLSNAQEDIYSNKDLKVKY